MKETIYTDCPLAFDGFSTRTVAVIGQTRNGPLRKVECDQRDFDWQVSRYQSGGVFECGRDDEFPAFLRKIGSLKDFTPEQRVEAERLVMKEVK